MTHMPDRFGTSHSKRVVADTLNAPADDAAYQGLPQARSVSLATDPMAIDRICLLFRELRASVRLELLVLLSNREMDVTSIAEELQREVSHVSQHLVFLQRHQWLVVLVRGRHRVYTLSPAVRLARDNGVISLSICEDGFEFGMTFRGLPR